MFLEGCSELAPQRVERAAFGSGRDGAAGSIGGAGFGIVLKQCPPARLISAYLQRSATGLA